MMLELVKDNLGDILSVGATIIIGVLVYNQNKNFHKRDEQLQERLNKVENKRILHNTTLNIYNNYSSLKYIMEEFNNDEFLFGILINNQIINNYIGVLQNLKNNLIFSLLQTKIVFKNNIEMCDSLKNIQEKYEKFFNAVLKYFSTLHYKEYCDAMKNVSSVKKLTILNSINQPFELGNNTYPQLNEVVAINDTEIKKEFMKQFEKENINNLKILSQDVIKCFTEEKFYSYFTEYLSIDNMDI